MSDIDVKGFFDVWRFLSNFHYVDVVFDGVTYPTVEHAYQAAKTLDSRSLFYTASEPKEARRLGQKVKLRPDWDTIKYSIMEDLVRQKFQRPDLKAKLLSTGNGYLEETNWWKDVYWGVCHGVGENNLGKILMKIRAELRG